MGAAILLYFALPAEPPLWVGFAAVALAAAALAAGWRLPVARFAAALTLAAALGFCRAELRTAAQPPFFTVPHGAVGMSGIVASIETLPDSRRLTLVQPRLDETAPKNRAVRIKLRPDDATPVHPGDSVDLYGMLFGPERPAYPGAWDSGRQDFFAGLGATGFALTPVRVTAAAPHDARLADSLRATIAATIAATLPVATGSIAITLLTGEESAIPSDERQNFITAGLAHILAVAGLHVGIVMGLVFGAARFLLTRSERLALRIPAKPVAAVLALAAGGGYAALTGAHLPILRSLAMAALVTAGVLAGRRAISLRGLALAASLILLTTPEAIIGASFQMSFSAVLALIAGYAALPPGLLHAPHPARRLAGHVAALALTSLLAGGASMPFAAFNFQQMQPYWVPANLIAVPLTALWIMPLGLLSLALMPLHLAALALLPMSWGIAVIVWVTGVIAAWPAALLRIPPLPGAAIVIIAAGLIMLCIFRTKPRLAGIPLIAFGIALACTARAPDVLVSSDATLLAVRSGPDMFLVREPKASNFVVSQWAALYPALTQAACSAATCMVGPVLFAAEPPAACPPAALAISPEPLRGACSGIPVIDRVSVYENGATAAWLSSGGVRLRTDRAVQGDRPWVIAYPSTTLD
jgi:competence protein ComEC